MFQTPPFSVETAIIFDWDDTLFPSTWVCECKRTREGENGGEAQSPHTNNSKAHLHLMEQEVFSCLSQAIHQGNVIIITNSYEGWVRLSAGVYFPSVVELLDSVWVVSARSLFSIFSEDPVFWKHEAFRYCLSKVFEASEKEEHNIKKIISIGDSNNERNALFSAVANIPNSVFVSVKLFDSPSLETLLEEVSCLRQNMQNFFKFWCNQDLFFRTIELNSKPKAFLFSSNQVLL
mmetsp:Transcript_2405/g.3394  ORF Transcript_2405/g.3394 Transcript_2405/m.3394 type:complete len:234 (-) Transcript_2405:102-803(-)